MASIHSILKKTASIALLSGLLLPLATQAAEREQAKRIYERLTGLTPPEQVVVDMADQIVNESATAAALSVLNGEYGDTAVEGFLGGTLKRMAAPWTNRDQDPFVPLNDYMATFIGIVKDERDAREMLYGNVLYTHPAASPNYSASSNAHYEDIEARALPLDDLTATSQSYLPSDATAGLMTTRAGAKAFFYLGTNRAMLRFTLMAHLCTDLEQMEDPAGVPDRIRQDVSRSPGGDSRLFLTGCVGCHIGMDPLAQSFAYYDWEVDPDGDTNTDDGFIVYNTTPQPNPELGRDTRVQPKYHINANNFPYGYVTLNDNWDNYWREGLNSSLGWNYGNDQPFPDGAQPPNGSGSGAKSMGRELANSYAFAQCQVRKAFKAVCLREPATYDNLPSGHAHEGDATAVATITGNFKANGYNLKQVFAETANYCKGN